MCVCVCFVGFYPRIIKQKERNKVVENVKRNLGLVIFQTPLAIVAVNTFSNICCEQLTQVGSTPVLE